MEYYTFPDALNRCSTYSLYSIIATNSKLRRLQYSTIHRIYGCKYNLNLWDIIKSHHYWNCNKVDTLEYYFHSDQSKSKWNEKKMLNAALGIHLNFTVLEILLSIPYMKNTTHHVFNLLTLFTKHIIYAHKATQY